MAESIVFIFKPECFTLLLSSPKNVMYVLNAENLYTPFFSGNLSCACHGRHTNTKVHGNKMFLFQGTRDDKIVMVHKPIFAPLEEVLVNGEFAGPEELAAHESRAACFGGWPEVERAAVSAQRKTS